MTSKEYFKLALNGIDGFSCEILHIISTNLLIISISKLCVQSAVLKWVNDLGKKSVQLMTLCTTLFKILSESRLLQWNACIGWSLQAIKVQFQINDLEEPQKAPEGRQSFFLGCSVKNTVNPITRFKFKVWPHHKIVWL